MRRASSFVALPLTDVLGIVYETNNSNKHVPIGPISKGFVQRRGQIPFRPSQESLPPAQSFEPKRISSNYSPLAVTSHHFPENNVPRAHQRSSVNDFDSNFDDQKSDTPSLPSFKKTENSSFRASLPIAIQTRPVKRYVSSKVTPTHAQQSSSTVESLLRERPITAAIGNDPQVDQNHGRLSLILKKRLYWFSLKLVHLSQSRSKVSTIRQRLLSCESLFSLSQTPEHVFLFTEHFLFQLSVMKQNKLMADFFISTSTNLFHVELKLSLPFDFTNYSTDLADPDKFTSDMFLSTTETNFRFPNQNRLHFFVQSKLRSCCTIRYLFTDNEQERERERLAFLSLFLRCSLFAPMLIFLQKHNWHVAKC